MKSLLFLAIGIVLECCFFSKIANGQTLQRGTISSSGGIWFNSGSIKQIQCVGEPAIGANSPTLNGSAYGFLSGEGIEEVWTAQNPILCKGTPLRLKKTIIGDEISNFRWIVFQDSTGAGLIADSVLLYPGQDTLLLSLPLWLPSSLTIRLFSDLGEVYSQKIRLTPPDTVSVTSTICAGKNLIWNGDTIKNAGTYLKNKFDSLGCLEIHRLTLHTLPVKRDSLQHKICERSSFFFGGKWLNQNGYYQDTLTATNGCDSIVSLQLTVLTPLFTSLHDSLCSGQSYFFKGKWLRQSGTYFDTLFAINGCDSIVSLRLDFRPPLLSTTQSLKICQGDSLFFQGTWLKTSGLYTDTLTNGIGCDSILRLQLTVLIPWKKHDTLTVCQGDSIWWQGRYLKHAGNYHQIWTSINNCDSIYYLHLKQNPTKDTMIVRFICSGQSFQFNQQNLIAPGTYLAKFPSSTGCDSTVRLTLFIFYPSSRLIHDTICEGQTFLFQGIPLAQAGTYTVFLTNSSGCDSIVTLELYVRFRPSKPLVIRVADTLYSSTISGNQWYDLNGLIPGANLRFFVPNVPAKYYARVSQGGCQSEPSDTIDFIGTANAHVIKPTWRLYPNPVQNYFTVESEEMLSTNYRWRIITMDGKLVEEGISSQSILNFSTEYWSNGVYGIQILTDQNIQFLRFLLAR